jgi:CRISPR-associated protein Csm4
MKTYEITIKPLSGFGTPIKGDTLFGQICWQTKYQKNIFSKDIDSLLSDYLINPFIVVSSAFPKIGNKIALKRPELPLEMLFSFNNISKMEIIRKRKDYKNKIWLLISYDKILTTIKDDNLYFSDEELVKDYISSLDIDKKVAFRRRGIKSLTEDFIQSHNTINRITGTTGEGRFAPYTVEQKFFLPDIELVIFIGVRDDIRIEMVIETIKTIGKIGFGKDSSIGLGKFEIAGFKEVDLKKFFDSSEANACYALSPVVPDVDKYEKIYFSPFVRFGRHGDVLAKSSNPFKNPVIMADEGSVFIIKEKEIFKKPYIGKALTNLSKSEPKTVSQGYSLYIPVKVEA